MAPLRRLVEVSARRQPLAAVLVVAVSAPPPRLAVDLVPPRLVDLVNQQPVVLARPHLRADSASHHRQQPQLLGSARLAPHRLVSANRRPVSANLNPVVSAPSAPRRSNHNPALARSVLHNHHRPHPTRRSRKCAVSTELLNITRLVQKARAPWSSHPHTSTHTRDANDAHDDNRAQCAHHANARHHPTMRVSPRVVQRHRTRSRDVITRGHRCAEPRRHL